MAKYLAKNDVPPHILKGDIVEFNDPLVEGLKHHFEAAPDDAEVTDIENRNPLTDRTAAKTQVDDGLDPTAIVNPSRDELKKEAVELGIDFAPNITTDRLMELVKEGRAKKAAE